LTFLHKANTFGRAMGCRGATLISAFAAIAAAAPAALAAGPVSVSYGSPAALQGLHVLARVAPLHVAEIASADLAVARTRSGIRVLGPTVARRHLGSVQITAVHSTASEWEFTATHSNLVPASVQHAASRITIAVVDTGADLSVPVIAAKSPITYNAVTGDESVSDDTGHGTFVASVAAGASSNGSVLRGFGGDAKLMIVQANRDPNTFDDVDEAAGIVWAVDHGANIINLSIGGADTSQVEQQAIQYAIAHNVLLVAAAGNTGLGGNVPSYPAALVGANGLAVGATMANGKRASFSTAASYVSVAAPGVSVLGATTSTASSSEFPRAITHGTGLYAWGTGTSYSAPQVSGAAALVWAANPSLTAPQVAQLIETTAAGSGTRTAGTGFGVLNVAAAVAKARGAAAKP
jgi:subtilisin family serine protease